MVLSPATRCALAKGSDACEIARAAADILALKGEGGTLGFVYATDSLTAPLPEIVERLREFTGVEDWTGTVGFGVMAGREAAFDEPAIAVMITNWPKEHYQFFQGGEVEAGFGARNEPFGGLATAIVHANPRDDRFAHLLQSLAATSGAYPMGGITGSRSGYYGQIAGCPTEAGISGVLAAPGIGMAIGVSQGCTAAGPLRTVTAAEGNIILELDGMRPLDVLLEDLRVQGVEGIDDLRPVLRTMHVSLMVPNCDTGDYLVRNFTGIGSRSGVIGIGDLVEEGQKLFFSRRDREAAASDLKAMVSKVRGRVGKATGALYVSCCGRGPHLFESTEAEIELVQDVLGDIPLTGFYANGEIAGDRIYSYTGVLAVF